MTGRKYVRSCLVLLAAPLLASRPSLAEAAPTSATEQGAVVDFARKAVVRALDYKQGDRESLIDAREDFTAGGWNEFMKRMDGWLDAKGAPLGSQSFTPTGDAVVTSQENGVIKLSIPGTLKQTQNKSSATYRVIVEVELSGNPIRIEHLEPTIRLGASATRK